MGLHTAEVIVLRRYPFRETSVTLTCLTDRFGKLKGLVKGLRAQPNRHHSAMEPFTINRIVFYDTRTSQLHLISQCELIAPLSQLVNDLETMRAAALFAELVDAVVPLEEPQPVIYQLLRDGLERLSLGGDPAPLSVHFIVRLLRVTGFRPRLDECTGCNAVVSAPPSGFQMAGQAAGYWSAQQGGLLCQRCLHQDPKADVASFEMLTAMEALSHADHPPALEPALIPQLRRWLDEFLRWRVEKPLKTLAA